MNSIEFIIDKWYEPDENLKKYEDNTFVHSIADFRIEITQNSNKVALTEVSDPVDKITRPHIIVPVYPIALWLLCDWWRIRWEPKQDTHEWKMSHRMSGALEHGYVWPLIEFSSIGDFIQVSVKEDTERPFNIHYTQKLMTIDIPAEQFESAVDKFVSQVAARLKSEGIKNPLQEIIDELAGERSDPTLYNELKSQALASNYENI